jgi:hypothetical protein
MFTVRNSHCFSSLDDDVEEDSDLDLYDNDESDDAAVTTSVGVNVHHAVTTTAASSSGENRNPLLRELRANYTDRLQANNQLTVPR